MCPLLCFASSLVEFCYYKIRGWCMVPLNASPKRALALARQSMNRSSCNVNYSSGGTVSQFSWHWVKIRNFKDLVLPSELLRNLALTFLAHPFRRLVGLRPRRRQWIRLSCILMVQPSSGGGPKDVKNAKREVQWDLFWGRVSGRMEGSFTSISILRK
jgi:hypothetical protein